MRRLQEPVADLETDNRRQIDEQGGDQGGPTDCRAVKEVLNRPVQVCVKAGGVEHPESGKGETGDQIKPSAEKSHGAAFSGIVYRRECDARHLVTFLEYRGLPNREKPFFVNSARQSYSRLFPLIFFDKSNTKISFLKRFFDPLRPLP